jgi:hypothetical protein
VRSRCRGKDRGVKRRANWTGSEENSPKFEKEGGVKKEKAMGNRMEKRRGKLREREERGEGGGNTEGGVVGIYRT